MYIRVVNQHIKKMQKKSKTESHGRRVIITSVLCFSKQKGYR